jgi:hypothetical protein
MYMQIRTHHRIESTYAGHYLEIGQILTIHERLHRWLEEQFHPADLDHFLQVVVDAVGFGEELLVQRVDHHCGGTFEVCVEKPRERDNRRKNRDGEYQQNFKKVGLEDP